MKLSLRLETLLALVTPGYVFCDIGCDHGFLSIEAVRRGISPRIIATDLREGPLRTAEAHIKEADLSDEIETRLSDGVASVQPGEAETYLIAGMGGRVILHILTEGDAVFRAAKEIILQPQSEIFEVRRYLAERGFWYTAEELVEEDGKFYPMLRGRFAAAQRGVQEQASTQVKTDETMQGFSVPEPAPDLTLPPEAIYAYGPLLLKNAHPVLRRYLQKERDEQKKILASLPETAAARRDTVTKKLALIERIFTEVYHEGL